MVAKKQPKRRSFRRRRTFRRKKRSMGKVTKELIAYIPRGMQTPICPKYRCKFNADCQIAYIAAGSFSAETIAISLNSLFKPYASSGITPGTNLIFGPATPTTLQPAGFSSLLNANLYTRYRVYSSKISIKAVPSAQADTIMLSICPSNNPAVPINTQTSLSQPYAKSKLVQSNQSGNIVKNYCTQHKLLGVTKRAIEDDLSGNYAGTNAAAPANQLYWVVNWETVDAVDITTPLLFDIKLEYYVELWGNQTAALLET